MKKREKKKKTVFFFPICFACARERVENRAVINSNNLSILISSSSVSSFFPSAVVFLSNPRPVILALAVLF